MATEVHPNLFVGGVEVCAMPGRPAAYAAIVHAAKFPCHATLLGYTGKDKAPRGHAEYLIARRDGHLVLNMIDPPVPDFFSTAQFIAALDFLDAHHGLGERCAVHCNLGGSRAPSIALLFLAKRLKAIPADSFAEARRAFLPCYPSYTPGQGIEMFLTKAWDQLA